MSVKELAEECKCSKVWIYYLMHKYYNDKLPTKKQVLSHRGKGGRPLKYGKEK